MKTNTNKPDIMQVFDKFIDREYYKIVRGIFFTSHVKVRADRIKDWKEWKIECDTLPDKIYVNGVEYHLKPKEFSIYNHPCNVTESPQSNENTKRLA